MKETQSEEEVRMGNADTTTKSGGSNSARRDFGIATNKGTEKNQKPSDESAKGERPN